MAPSHSLSASSLRPHHPSFESLRISSPRNNSSTSSSDAECIDGDGDNASHDAEKDALLFTEEGYCGDLIRLPSPLPPSPPMEPAQGRRIPIFSSKEEMEPFFDLSNRGYAGGNSNSEKKTTLGLLHCSSTQRTTNHIHGDENHVPAPQIARNAVANNLFNRRRRKASVSVRESLLAEAWERKRELMLNKEENGSSRRNAEEAGAPTMTKGRVGKVAMAGLGRSSSDCCGTIQSRRRGGADDSVELESEEEVLSSSSSSSPSSSSPSSLSAPFAAFSASSRFGSESNLGFETNELSRTRTRSLTDDDFEELKGCIDLGFGFDHASVPPALCETLPALQVYCAVAQSLVHESPTSAKTLTNAKALTNTSVTNNQSQLHPLHHPTIAISSCSSVSSVSSPPTCSPSTPTWRISSPGDDPKDVKGRLRHWAQAVACNAKLFC